MWRIGVTLIAVAAGAATGALVFKMVGEEQIGGSVKVIGARLGFVPSGSAAQGQGALDFLDKIAPGSKSDLTNAVILTVVATVVSAAVVAVIVEEVAT